MGRTEHLPIHEWLKFVVNGLVNIQYMEHLGLGAEKIVLLRFLFAMFVYWTLPGNRCSYVCWKSMLHLQNSQRNHQGLLCCYEINCSILRTNITPSAHIPSSHIHPWEANIPTSLPLFPWVVFGWFFQFSTRFLGLGATCFCRLIQWT